MGSAHELHASTRLQILWDVPAASVLRRYPRDLLCKLELVQPNPISAGGVRGHLRFTETPWEQSNQRCLIPAAPEKLTLTLFFH